MLVDNINKKKILIVNIGSLFPMIMMNQNRVFQMIKRLSVDHTVDVMTPYRTENELEESKKRLKDVCNRFYPVKSYKYNFNLLNKIFHRINFFLFHYFQGGSLEYFNYSNIIPQETFLNVIDMNKYDILIIHYWLQAGIFDMIGSNLTKVIDIHDILHEKKEIDYNNKYKRRIPFFKRKELENYGQLEKKILRNADLVIANSKLDYNYLRDVLSIKKRQLLLIQNGQDLEYFKKAELKISDYYILFYGSMGGVQNIKAFKRFYKNIFPIIKKEITNIKLLVVGANPPSDIVNLDNGIDIFVTGYVEDIREYLSKSYLMILPLVIGVGFRGRTVEVMAAGIPVIGTHNALDSIEMTHGKHGYISDDDVEMANYAIKLFQDRKLRDKMSQNCIEFVSQKYSIKATYGKLSKYFQQQ